METAEIINNPKASTEEPVSSFCLKLRQSPSQADVCPTAGNDRDKKQLEPAAIDHDETLLFQPFLFAAAVLIDTTTQREVYFLEDNQTSILTGSTTSSVHNLLDPENDLKAGSFLIFPDISVRKAGTYTLKIVLFKIEGQGELATEPFEVVATTSGAPKRKKIPPTALSKSFSSQGMKMKLKRQPRSNWVIENANNSPPPAKRRKAEPDTLSDEPEINVKRPRKLPAKAIENEDESENYKPKVQLEAVQERRKLSSIRDLLNGENGIHSDNQSHSSTNPRPVTPQHPNDDFRTLPPILPPKRETVYGKPSPENHSRPFPNFDRRERPYLPPPASLLHYRPYRPYDSQPPWYSTYPPYHRTPHLEYWQNHHSRAPNDQNYGHYEPTRREQYESKHRRE
ncbi:hypothetical protein HDV01_005711 [Terramyces sp. JEL0728]|nr:hypothetical protein HDV01_005711 [Terramyces sp. JEL0728]